MNVSHEGYTACVVFKLRPIKPTGVVGHWLTIVVNVAACLPNPCLPLPLPLRTTLAQLQSLYFRGIRVSGLLKIAVYY